MELHQIIKEVSTIVKAVGRFIVEESQQITSENIEHKSLNNLVSYVDRNAEKKLVQGLASILPEATFLTEEGTIAEQEGEWKWIIDPLDGTTNFVHQIPIFAISIGLTKGKDIKCGWVYNVMLDELFYAWENGGAYLNGQKISVSSQTDFEQSLLATGFPYDKSEDMKRYMAVFHDLMMNTRGLRRLGAAAVDLAYVACGRFDGFYEYNLNPWDVAGGSILVKEAGGMLMDFHGGNNYIFGQQIIATNGKITSSLHQTIQKHYLSK